MMVALACGFIARRTKREPAAKQLFAFSILYLFVLFAVLLVERAFGLQHFGLPFGRVFA